jgi:hypothetical protein
MRSAVSFQAIPVLIDGNDTEGSLVLHDGQLVAVLARLDGDSHDPDFKGRWHLEAGFGPCQEVGTRLFESLEDAARWAHSRVQTGGRAEMAEHEGTVSQSEPLTHAGTGGADEPSSVLNAHAATALTRILPETGRREAVSSGWLGDRGV